MFSLEYFFSFLESSLDALWYVLFSSSLFLVELIFISSFKRILWGGFLILDLELSLLLRRSDEESLLSLEGSPNIYI